MTASVSWKLFTGQAVITYFITSNEIVNNHGLLGDWFKNLANISLKILQFEIALFGPKLITLVGVLPCNVYQTWSNLEQNIVFVLVYFVFYVQRLCSIGVFVPVLKRPCLISQSGFSLPKLWHSMTVKNRLLIKLFFRTLVILKSVLLTKLLKEIYTDNGPLEKCKVCKQVFGQF